MVAKRPAPSLWAVLAAGMILLLFGASMLYVCFNEFWQRPDLASFGVLYFLGVCPLYVSAVAFHSAVAYSRGSVVRFPDRTPRLVLFVNLLVFGPPALALGGFGRALLGAAITASSWRTLAAIAILGLPLLEIYLFVRIIFRRSLSELGMRDEESQEDGEPRHRAGRQR